jgi:hypothetical protein
VSPTQQPEEVGSYIISFEVCLANYPSQCVTFSSSVVITDCVITAVQVVESPGLGALSLQNYYLTNTPFAYPLTTKQTPNCGYTSSGWAVTVTGTNPTYTTNFAVINPATGVYGFGGMNQADRVGTYTIAISAVVLNGVTYSGS